MKNTYLLMSIFLFLFSCSQKTEQLSIKPEVKKVESPKVESKSTESLIVSVPPNDNWIYYSPDKIMPDWEVKQNGFNSRRLDKKSLKEFKVKDNAFTVESHYQSIGKFICTKKSFSNFVLEAEFMTSDLRSGAFIGYHGQFLDTQWKGKGKTYKGLHSFSYSFGNWPKTTGEAEIRYTGAGKSLVDDHKEVQIKKDTWHKVKIVVANNTIQHWFDGQLVAELKNVAEALKSKDVKSENPMKGPIILGMPGHPKGQKQVITVKWRDVRVKEL